MKPHLRWNGLIWADPSRLLEAWRYWRVWHHTTLPLAESWAMRADCYAELMPRGQAL